MGMLQEFKEFAIRGNVADLAVGVIIGAAFTRIVNSLVNDVIMPPVGLVLGGVDFSYLVFTLKQKTATSDAVAIRYGAFINAVIDFTIVAFAIFLVMKRMNRLKKKEESKPAEKTKECARCCSDIPMKATRCPHCTSELQTV